MSSQYFWVMRKGKGSFQFYLEFHKTKTKKKNKNKKTHTFPFWMPSQYVWILRYHPICLPLPEALLTLLKLWLTMVGCLPAVKPF